jgi:hypothetical protein
MNVETEIIPPAIDGEDDGDRPSVRVACHLVGDKYYDAAVQLFDEAGSDPKQIADALLCVALGLAQLCGPDVGWAAMQRFTAYDGGIPR